jgi:hypothetical protein
LYKFVLICEFTIPINIYSLSYSVYMYMICRTYYIHVHNNYVLQLFCNVKYISSFIFCI